MSLKAPKGTIDILPKDSAKWQFLEKTLRDICDAFQFQEIRIPVFEHTELYVRGVGETSDVVSKEMYTFNDKGDRSITLRPEGTAGVVRSFLEHGLFADSQPTKLYYLISCYRYEKPQAGRLREFRQFGVEMFGASSPAADAEVISLVKHIFDALGITNLTLNINNIGCPSCRKAYNEQLKAYLNERKDSLCETCRERLERNPMRVFDCKSEICQSLLSEAPRIYDCVCEDCHNHFSEVTSYLEEMGIAYQIDKSIVRGLDYYSRTVFEFVSNNIGAQGTVCGGGRYDYLVEELGGKPCPGIGFAMGIERLLMVLENAGITLPEQKEPQLYIAAIGKEADKKAAKIVNELRCAGIRAEKDYMERSVKAQMKYANKIKAAYTMVLGDDEIAAGEGQLKQMDTGETRQVRLEELKNMFQ